MSWFNSLDESLASKTEVNARNVLIHMDRLNSQNPTALLSREKFDQLSFLERYKIRKALVIAGYEVTYS